jgi:hypothetical protein
MRDTYFMQALHEAGYVCFILPEYCRGGAIENSRGKEGADGRVAEGMARFLAEPVPTLSAMFCIV